MTTASHEGRVNRVFPRPLRRPPRTASLPISDTAGAAVHAHRILHFLALSYVLWLPVSRVEILYPTLFVLATLGLFRALRSRMTMLVEFHLFWIVFTVVTLAWALLGSIYENPGLSHQLLIWLGGATIWGFWAAGLRLADIRPLLIVVTVVVGLLSLMMLFYVLEQYGFIPPLVPRFVVVSQAAGFSVDGDGSAIRFLSLSTLTAGAPLMMAGALVKRDKLLPPRWLLIVSAMLAIAAAYVAGRRAILAVIPLAIIYIAIFTAFLRPRSTPSSVTRKRVSLLLISITGVVLVILFADRWRLPRPMRAMIEGVAILANAPALASSRSPSDTARSVQATRLFEGWEQHPLLGAGLGASLPDGFFRSVSRPWMFELQYHQMLLQLGLLGSGLVIVSLCIALRGIRRAALMRPEHRPVLVASLTAAMCLLTANASNPYLQTPGHWWGAVLVIGIANAVSTSSGGDPITVDDDALNGFPHL